MISSSSYSGRLQVETDQVNVNVRVIDTSRVGQISSLNNVLVLVSDVHKCSNQYDCLGM